MNQEIKAAWTAALRSGNFPQGRRRLRSASGEYCCLGVLCELGVRAGIIPPGRPDLAGDICYGQEETGSYLPQEIQRWAGLDDFDPEVMCGSRTRHLAGLNDDGKPFTEIADLIDASL